MSIEAVRSYQKGYEYQKAVADQAEDVLAAILAIPKFANGIRVPRSNIAAKLGRRIHVVYDPQTNDLILSLDPR